MADDFHPDRILETDEQETPDGEETPNGEEQKFGGLSREDLADVLKENREATERLMRQQQPQARQPLQRDDFNINFEGLPDPQMDLNGFLKGVSTRAGTAIGSAISQAEERIMQRAAERIAVEQAKSRADAMVKAADPTLSDKLIAAAANEVSKRYQAEGKNLVNELVRNTDTLAQDVLEQINDWREEMGEKRRSTALTDDTVANRGQGLVSARGRVPRPPAKQGRPDRGLYDDIVKAQRTYY